MAVIVLRYRRSTRGSSVLDVSYHVDRQDAPARRVDWLRPYLQAVIPVLE